MKMKSVTELEGCKIQVHVAIRRAPLCNIGRLLLGVNTNVRSWRRLCKNVRDLDANGTAHHFKPPSVQAGSLAPTLIRR